MPVMVLFALAGAVLAAVWMWQWLDRVDLAVAPVRERAAAQLDALKIAASVAVGIGGLFALYLAARRQRTQELELPSRHTELRHREAELAQRDRAQDDTRRDAEARRVTGLYSKSAEQLGSEKGSGTTGRPVRDGTPGAGQPESTL